MDADALAARLAKLADARLVNQLVDDPSPGGVRA
jgi:hypothetical protein